MINKILINAVDPDECRIAKIEDGQLEEFHIETASKEITKGNIYKGIITRIEPSLQAVFVDYGGEKQGFLQRNDIHSDYFLDNDSGDISLANLVQKGQELFVQVTKDPIQKKGAMLTTFISLAGRNIVLLPGGDSKGVSRKIEDETERKRLKEIIDKIKVPDGFGIIIRTAGENCTKSVITEDLNYLSKLWGNINDKGIQEKAPALLHKERNLSVRAIRDYFTPDIKEILIDEQSIYQEIKQFMEIISPKDSKLVKLYKGEKPIFSKHKVEDQISSIYKKQVKLKSGGYIVIEQTEALVSIDVNSGKATQRDNMEDTALQTDLEASKEIARQLRLRDLGGLIIIDFIDMREQKHKIQIEKALKNHLKLDKARTKIGKISKFGLLEMSRQRISSTIEYGSFITCKLCQGRGVIHSVESLGLSFLRQLRLETTKDDILTVNVIVPMEVANYLLNKKRREISELEILKDISINIEGDAYLPLGNNKISCEFKKKE